MHDMNGSRYENDIRQNAMKAMRDLGKKLYNPNSFRP